MSPRVGIVGAGPVGMYLALRLVRAGHAVRVLDRRTGIRPHSRSIGIHPPSWRMLNDVGVGTGLLERATRVREGEAWWAGRRVGRMSLDGLDGYVLSIPQHHTEALMEDALRREAPDSLVLGQDVSHVEEWTDRVVVRGPGLEDRFDVLVGCDGSQSTVRSAVGIAWSGASYEIPYLMGDAPDSTDRPGCAIIMLGPKGLVESFPLPGGLRRWVVRLEHPVAAGKTGAAVDPDHAALLCRVIADRTPFRVHPGELSMTSAFGVERREAMPMASRRVFLAGDAAHVVSPIGGQGMNLGWHDAAWLAERLSDTPLDDLAERYARVRKQAFRAAARRAEFNMWMGAACGPGGAAARRLLVRAALLPGVRSWFLSRFTMEGLPGGSGNPR